MDPSLLQSQFWEGAWLPVEALGGWGSRGGQLGHRVGVPGAKHTPAIQRPVEAGGHPAG